LRCPPATTLFPYTTLFRSIIGRLFGPSHGDVPPLGLDDGPRGDVLQRAVALARLNDTGLRAGGNNWVQTIAADSRPLLREVWLVDRKSTRLNSSHVKNSYA